MTCRLRDGGHRCLGSVLSWRGTVLFCVGGNPRDQPIAALRDRLDEARLPGIVTEDSSQFRDARVNTSSPTKVSGQTACISRSLGTDLTGMRRKAHEHLHHLRFQANGAGGSGHAVERRLDMMDSPMRKPFCNALLSAPSAWRHSTGAV